MQPVRLAILVCMVVTAAARAAEPSPPGATPNRAPWITSRLVGSPEPLLPFTVERCFAGLKLPAPIYVCEEPDTQRLLAVLHASGQEHSRIVAFENSPDVATSQPYFELPNRLLYAICFDPQFAANRQVYVFSNGPTNQPERRNRVSRYRVASGSTANILPVPRANTRREVLRLGRKRSLRIGLGTKATARNACYPIKGKGSQFSGTHTFSRPAAIDPASEEVILEWRSAGHDGGDLEFGLDGMLYVTTGDGTGDSDGWDSGQTVDDLLGAVLRIDVRGGDGERRYRIPPDNPFVDTKGARGEIWAYGLRNPWRMGIDARTGQVWVGNNGQDMWETAHLVRRGENYGWSVYEGSHPFYLERRRGPTPIVAPTIEHSHAEFRSLTGGVVYYGDKHPELVGAYVYGDYASGRIWGMKHDGQRVEWHRELADTTLAIAAFRVDSGGNLLVVDHGGGIYRLAPAPLSAASAPFPTRLSETGLFASTAEHRVEPALIPYAVNVPGWADGAVAERFMALPPDGRVTYDSNRSWTFPDGTALVQTLSLAAPGSTTGHQRIETRVLLRQQGEWAGYTYRWHDDQQDATLVPRLGADADVALRSLADGQSQRQSWRFPSRVECMTCHSRAANFVLGISEAQLNRDHKLGSVPENQLRALERLDVFSTALGQTPAESGRLVDPNATAADLEARARSYLHVNCSNCHVAAGGGNAQMELGIATARDKVQLIEARPQHDTFGIENAMLVAPGDPQRSVLVHRLALRGRGQMPPLVSHRVDAGAVELMRAWIASLPSTRRIVRHWQTAELVPALEELAASGRPEAGRTAFRETGCVQCHRYGSDGGSVGPDITNLAKRLSSREVLEAIIEPSKKIADEFAAYIIETDDGQVATGRIEREDAGVLVLRAGGAADEPMTIEKQRIIARRKSPVSNMPAGTVDVLEKQQILDLLAYLLKSPAP